MCSPEPRHSQVTEASLGHCRNGLLLDGGCPFLSPLAPWATKFFR